MEVFLNSSFFKYAAIASHFEFDDKLTLNTFTFPCFLRRIGPHGLLPNNQHTLLPTGTDTLPVWAADQAGRLF